VGECRKRLGNLGTCSQGKLRSLEAAGKLDGKADIIAKQISPHEFDHKTPSLGLMRGQASMQASRKHKAPWASIHLLAVRVPGGWGGAKVLRAQHIRKTLGAEGLAP
jgi:hypothetical protein